jgi:Xaa-Pro aminopeptidase
MCHYHSSEASNKPIGHDHFYLNDSGGQYTNGTTDATRTLAWGQGPRSSACTTPPC